MKKLLFLLTIILIVNLTFAQNQGYEKVITEFQNNYNSGDYAKIFSSFSEKMKTALPLEKTNEFLSGLKSQAGNITNKEFIEFKNGSYASYKTTFEKAIFSVNISVDEQGKINGLFVQPFQEKIKNDKKVVNALTGLSDELMEVIFNETKDFPNKTQLAFAFIDNDSTKFYGIIKENDSIKFIDNRDMVFEIGSVSKVFTSTLLADAVVNKKIKSDDKINPFYSFPFKDGIELDFKSLANHTSGLPRLPSNLDLSKVNPQNPYEEYGVANLNEYLKNDLKLDHQTGAQYDYSNLGAGLLGYTLGLVQKSNYNKLLNEKIFNKYKMNNSFTNSNQVKTELVRGLDKDGKVVSNWDFGVLEGAGGILSSVVDLSKFVRAQFDPKNEELALTRIPTFTVSDKMKIGLGWHIIKSESGKDVYWHNGGTGGYSSSVAMDIGLKKGVVILSNVSAFNPDMKNIDKLCFELPEHLKK